MLLLSCVSHVRVVVHLCNRALRSILQRLSERGRLARFVIDEVRWFDRKGGNRLLTCADGK